MLCNCGIEVEKCFLLESLAACHDENSKLVIHSMVNTAFVNYHDSLNNLTDSSTFPILMNRTTFEQTLPISLNVSNFDSKLLTAHKTLKGFVHQYNHKKEIFDLQKGHTNMELELPNKNSFNNYTIDIFLFVAEIISLLVTTIVMYILCKHMKLKTLVTRLALQQIKEVGAVPRQEDVMSNIECTCKIQ